MDPLSVAASVAGIAAMGVQLSQTIYALISTISQAEKEMSDIAKNLSLLAMVLNELEFVLRGDSRVYRRRMVVVVNEILTNCQGVFRDISKYVSTNPGDKRSSKQFHRKIRWYFQRHRVKPLQAGLESMKSTLNVLLHVVNLARVSEGAELFIPDAGTIFTHADVQRERKVLIGIVLDNRRSILSLKRIEDDRDRGRNFRNILEDKPEFEKTDKAVTLDGRVSVYDHVPGQSEMTDSSPGWHAFTKENKNSKNIEEGRNRRQKDVEDKPRKPRVTPLKSNITRTSVPHSAYVADVSSEVSERSFNGSNQIFLTGVPQVGPIYEADDLSDRSMSQHRPLSRSSASEEFETPPESSFSDTTESDSIENDIPTKSTRSQIVNAKVLASKAMNSPESPSGGGLVTPSARWFLSVVPHESSFTSLIPRPRAGQANHLRARAEATAKTLLLTWTKAHPESVFGNDSESWNDTESPNRHDHAPARDQRTTTSQYQMPYPPQLYPPYGPQQWYQPPVQTLPPSTRNWTSDSRPPRAPSPPGSPLPPPDEKRTDTEALARLKKLILDEKAEQDAREAAPPAAYVPPTASVESLQDTIQHDVEYSDSSQMPQEHDKPRKAEPQKLQAVIMRDWLGRKFIFPLDMCQTWEGLHGLIEGAFRNELEYRAMIEKGEYLISQITGEFLLPSTWEWFVEPGLEINIGMLVYEADRSDFDGKAAMVDQEDQTSPKSPIPPHAPEAPESPKMLRSRHDDERSVDGEHETKDSFSDVVSYVERSDPRYLSIENVLLEQKQAKVEAEMKMERNRRFFELKQSLVEQGAAIQALENAADHVEQDSKLAWLEKRVREQKEELDRLPPLFFTSPSSSAGDSASKSTSSSQRRGFFGARLLGRIPSRNSRSQGSIRSQQMITEG